MSRPILSEPLHGPAGPHQQLTIAPNLQPKKQGKPTGITIRTSRHWVLPPRPKPGRKPSPSMSIKQQIATVKGGSGTEPPAASSAEAPAGIRVKQEPVDLAKEVAISKPGLKKFGAANAAPTSITLTPKTSVPPVASPAEPSSIPLTTCKLQKGKAKQAHAELTTTCITHTQPKPLRTKISPAAPKKQVMQTAKAVDPVYVKPQVKMEQLDVTIDHIQSQTTETKKKPGSKTALKKEIKILKMENNKLKKELTDLVGNLQELKRQFPIGSESPNGATAHAMATTSNVNVPMKQKILPKPATGKSFHEPPHLKQEFTKYAEKSSRKRSIIDTNTDPLPISVKPEPADDTEIFLKFDEDEEPSKDFIKNLSSSKMIATSSLSSRASLTDEDDLLLSSSTPSSLFSTDLGRTYSNQLLSNSSSFPNTGSSPSSSHTSNKSLPNSQYSDAIEAMKFLDGHEQMEFYSKYKFSATHSQEPLISVQNLKMIISLFSRTNWIVSKKKIL
ncbi:unnamed protein product [Kluyveromyces dobzhanskii CBS 2104]|uniref:WGS project CCBQ000000000 data, contig 00010 n=1 Tax=Kluyveromyces dobzhanskii CBS 2104 TaxID=1427455 RepID=A0A0A8LAD3_9SACH|nr:unnamed protein product [Kluyveromyces dobzhanskii CBS 2104]